MSVVLLEDNPGDIRLFEVAAPEVKPDRYTSLSELLSRLYGGDLPDLIVADLHVPPHGPEDIIAALTPFQERVVLFALFTPEHPMPSGWRAVSKGDGTFAAYAAAVREVLAFR